MSIVKVITPTVKVSTSTGRFTTWTVNLVSRTVRIGTYTIRTGTYLLRYANDIAHTFCSRAKLDTSQSYKKSVQAIASKTARTGTYMTDCKQKYIRANDNRLLLSVAGLGS